MRRDRGVTSICSSATRRSLSWLATLHCSWPCSELPPGKLGSHGPRDAASPGESQADQRRELRDGGQKARAALGAGPQTFRRARGWNASTPATRSAMTDEQAWRLDELREEARYRRERLELYRARMYGGRAHSGYRLREYERASEGASARLRRAEAQLSNSSAERLGDS
jgi:hypothetical protein